MLATLQGLVCVRFYGSNPTLFFFLKVYIISGAHDGKKGVGARNAHALMSFSVS